MAYTTENPNEENIKCVVVGDNNVGKTRLVCARAHLQYGPNNQYLRYGGTHIPTVWANDHYRNDSGVLDNARDVVDGVNVSLRLWDTFGDHNKNRKFSYGRADVIIVCFSVCDRKSLEHIKSFWLPDIRRHCKGVPVLIVGCKIDLRFADLEDLNKRKNTLARKIRSDDILYPEICKQTAMDAGCPYYETSVGKGFGIKELFQNAIRAALICKRKLYLYRNVQLKHVQKPLLQKPLLPPKPEPPKFPEKTPPTCLDFSSLFEEPSHSDIIIVGADFKFRGHKVVLAAASSLFHNLFLSYERKKGKKILTSADDSKIFEDDSHSKGVCIETVGQQEMPCIQMELNFDDQVVPDSFSITVPDCCDTEDHEIQGSNPKQVFNFVSNYLQRNENDLHRSDVLELTSDVSDFAFKNIMYFCYTGSLSQEIVKLNQSKVNLQQVQEIFILSQRLGVYELANLLSEASDRDAKGYAHLKKFNTSRKSLIKELTLWKELYSDVCFETDDGSLPGHKALLVSGSEVMNKMFGKDFIESGNKIIPLPGTTVSSLKMLFEYIYTGDILLDESDAGYEDIIALANRFCLPDMINTLEIQIIKKFEEKASKTMTRDLHESIVESLVIAQLHNAHNLADWCVFHITTNYNDVCRKCKYIKMLSHENQKLLEKLRWPPVWYIKDFDNYERACRVKSVHDKEDQKRKTTRRT